MKPTPDARLMAVHNKRLGQWTLHDMRLAARGQSRTVAAVFTSHDPAEDEAWAYALANRFNTGVTLVHLGRAITLLKAAQSLIEASSDAISETVFYDDAECDGLCLVEDIEALLETLK